MEATIRGILVVVRSFGAYAVGHLIVDAAGMTAVLAGPHAGDVVRTVVAGAGLNAREEN